jgi:flagellar hook-length control protein FliK
LILYVCANKQGNFVRVVAELISDITDPLDLNSTIVGAASDEHDDSTTANDGDTTVATAAAAAAAAANSDGNDSDDDELSEEKLARQVSVTRHYVQHFDFIAVFVSAARIIVMCDSVLHACCCSA